MDPAEDKAEAKEKAAARTRHVRQRGRAVHPARPGTEEAGPALYRRDAAELQQPCAAAMGGRDIKSITRRDVIELLDAGDGRRDRRQRRRRQAPEAARRPDRRQPDACRHPGAVQLGPCARHHRRHAGRVGGGARRRDPARPDPHRRRNPRRLGGCRRPRISVWSILPARADHRPAPRGSGADAVGRLDLDAGTWTLPAEATKASRGRTSCRWHRWRSRS